MEKADKAEKRSRSVFRRRRVRGVMESVPAGRRLSLAATLKGKRRWVEKKN
jgi:hypothetical protein